jgi:hypothetical protein
LKLTSDPGGNGKAWFALVLLEVGEVGLRYTCTDRQFSLRQSASLARGADLLTKRRDTLG